MGLLKSVCCFAVVSSLIISSSVWAEGGAHVIEGDIVDVVLNDESSFFYLDAKSYRSQRDGLPIGVFDSGTGGLTVLDAIVNFDRYDNDSHTYRKNGDGVRDFCGESFIYLGDKANMPYGNYSKEGKADLLKEHIIKDVQFLLGNKYYVSGAQRRCRTDKPGVKAVVIACNTATAFGKADIERFMNRSGLDIKVIGVIDAGVRAAFAFVGKDEDASIAVLCTAGTVSSMGYVNALKAQMADMGYTGDIDIFQQAGIGLAGAIDGAAEYIRPDASGVRREYRGPVIANDSHLHRYGFNEAGNSLLTGENVQLNSVGNYIRYHVVTLMEKVRNKGGEKKLKVIILGCTHYPFYTEEFRAELERLYDYRRDDEYVYRPFMAKRIELVDPAPNVANELYVYLVEKGMFARGGVQKSRFYLSVPNVSNANNVIDAAGEFPYRYKYGREAGFIQEYVKRVPFGDECLGADVLERLAEKMPVVYEMIRAQMVR